MHDELDDDSDDEDIKITINRYEPGLANFQPDRNRNRPMLSGI